MREGRPTILRRKARNYHHVESQKRLDETVLPFNNQVLNSLSVDYVPVLYYHMTHTGQRCTCEHVEVPDAIQGVPLAGKAGGTDDVRASEDYEILDKQNFNALFGDNGSSQETADEDTDFDFDETEMVPVTSISQLFAGGNADCGICYRSGYVDSYSLNRGARITLSTFNWVDAEGFHVNKQEAPNTFERQHPDGYVLFSVTVPKYFKDVFYSIRNNRDIIVTGCLYDNNDNPLTRQYLRQNEGRTVEIIVKAPKFTHVVIEFHVNVDPILVNVAGLSKTLDYTTLETLGNLSVIAPMTIGAVGSGDIIAATGRNLYLKVVDVEYYQTAKMRQLEWRLQCRVLQPTEALKKISFHRKVV